MLPVECLSWRKLEHVHVSLDVSIEECLIQIGMAFSTHFCPRHVHWTVPATFPKIPWCTNKEIFRRRDQNIGRDFFLYHLQWEVTYCASLICCLILSFCAWVLLDLSFSCRSSMEALYPVMLLNTDTCLSPLHTRYLFVKSKDMSVTSPERKLNPMY